MNRRKFLSLLGGVPFLGFLKPEPAVASDVVHLTQAFGMPLVDYRPYSHIPIRPDRPIDCAYEMSIRMGWNLTETFERLTYDELVRGVKSGGYDPD